MPDAPDAAPQAVRLRPHAQRPGLYEGYISATRAGTYRVQAGMADRDLANTTEFEVADAQPEMADTAMQIDRLKRIADLSGGRCLDIGQINDLPALLDAKPHEVTYTTQIALWDNRWLMIALIGLAGVEWIVRRRYDLP
jgi:hypothetical protein